MATMFPNDTHATAIEAPQDLERLIIYPLTVLICLLGVVGNGCVIHILGFQIQRKPFNIYILNLAVADCGNLIALFAISIMKISVDFIYQEVLELFIFVYFTGLFLLIIISIDRCVALFFPIWHRCHQTPNLSTLVCAFTWITSFILSAGHYVLIIMKWYADIIYFSIYSFACLPIMVLSSLALLIRGCLQSPLQKRGKLLRAILASLFAFLAFTVPLLVITLYNFFYFGGYFYYFSYGFFCNSLNSSVNPLIYFLYGKKRECCFGNNLKTIFQRVFKEEEEEEEENGKEVEGKVENRMQLEFEANSQL